MRKWYVSILALAIASSAFADPPAPAPTVAPAAADPAPAVAQKPKNVFSLDGGVDFTTGYYFRGYKEQNKGLLIQPYATLSFNGLPSVGGATITPYVGTWNSIHTDDSGSSKSPRNWYETDLIGGVNIAKGPFTLGLLFTDYTSPAGAFRDTQEVGATLAFDDSDLDKQLHLPFALNPHIGIYRELNHSANFKTGKAGTYLEVGIEPSKSFEIGPKTVTFSIPTNVGMGFSNYYMNSNGSNTTLGYGSVGLKASVPLNSWLKLTGSVTYLHDFADSTKGFNGAKSDQVIGTVGLGFSL